MEEGASVRAFADALDRTSLVSEEAQALRTLHERRVPLVHGELVLIGDAEDLPGALAAGRRMLDRAEAVVVRPLLETALASERLVRRVGSLRAVDMASLEELLRRLLAHGLPASGRPLSLLVHPASVWGFASSASMLGGDPDVLDVRASDPDAKAFCVDRRSARVLTPGTGLSPRLAAAAADLSDRVQLVLGYPVEITWFELDGRPRVGSVRRAVLPTHTAPESLRRVTLVAWNEGTVAPLAVDVLDRALRVGPPLVRRIFARPYRAVLAPKALVSPMLSVAQASRRASQLGSDVTGPIALSRRLERGSRHRLRRFDEQDLRSMDRAPLMASLRDREALVREAFALLDRQLAATRATLTALSAATGPLPSAVAPALAAPRPMRGRLRVLSEMDALWVELGKPTAIDAAPTGSLRRRWELCRGRARDLRPLGIGIVPEAFGKDDTSFARALTARPALAAVAAERARRDAHRRLLATTQSRSMGVVRRALAQSLLAVLGRISVAKGRAAEVLAAGMLRLRAAAVVVGERVAREGLLESPEEALYLGMDELVQAMTSEPGAYASRARVRAEDDLRWRHYHAPERLGGD